jgi:hypothetical protein
MEDYQERVLKEKEELDDKLSRLTPFLTTEKFFGLPVEDRELLTQQEVHMKGYSLVLAKRIARFKS